MTESASAAPGRRGVAIIGAGAIALTHIRAVRAVPSLELVGVAARTRDSAARFLRDNGLDSDWAIEPVAAMTIDDALSDPRVGLVAIATPTGTHVELGMRALEAGRHVLIEKPVDIDPHRARPLVETAARAAAQHGLVAAAVSQQRYSPAADRVRAHLDDGGFGALTSAVASVGWWRSQRYYDSAEWRGTWAQDGGGALMNQGIHTLDLLLWMLGPARRVTARSAVLAHERIEVEDTLTALVEFESGALATVHATTAAYPGLAARLQIMGTRGSAVIEHGDLRYLHLARTSDDGSGRDNGNAADVGDMGLHGTANQIDAPDPELSRDATVDASGHARQYTALADDIRLGRRHRVTIADAVDTLTVIDAIYRSAATGLPVDIPRPLT
ncbi:Gfo/Idh/MocA family oxidoreductase [Schumannella luteola]|uniref:Putative dehydrogenase n=1 Tax=Schumannella luteola TaxID=472059 RepID=A0A852Y438_9MICO|nr:Gfo/Idh/MocA family oxidoreductase [Schumannella luteola]NYG97676.1 putative dehydrogenase [Schumannella luteola]TPX01449.1 Gfo/Idh/MocA family oxidoreductase [Schumannella luteola]